MRMSVVEAGAIALIFISLAQRTLWPGFAPASWSFIGLATALLLIALAINPLRWQLVPSIVVLLIILIQMIIAMDGGELAHGLSVPLSLASLALLAILAALSWGMPAGSLPAPEGPFKVGVATSEITRPSLSPGQSDRHLTIKIWYPAAPERNTREVEPLWSEMQSLQEIPAFVGALLAYLERIKTHSIINAPPAMENAPYPLLIYNHGLLSFTSENTLLMECLASHGYVVLSVRHNEQAAEYAAIQASISKEENAQDRKINALLRKASTREERARLSLESFRNSTGMSAIVHRRAEDSVFVLDNLDAVLARIPGESGHSIASSDAFGALGLSLGGAAATQLCVIDKRCASTANLDGGLYGINESLPLPSPYLMIYSADNAGTNDAFKMAAQDYTELVLTGAKHLDLHDATVIFPGLKWLGALGAGSGDVKSRNVRESVTAFFDRAMKR